MPVMLAGLEFTFPFRDRCRRCAEEMLHHHVGPKTRGTMHEGASYYCWCLDSQEPRPAYATSPAACVNGGK